jgi:hypothetical protein
MKKGQKRTGVVWNKGIKYKDINRTDIIEKSMRTKQERGIKNGNANRFNSKFELQLKPYMEKQGFIHNFRYSSLIKSRQDKKKY